MTTLITLLIALNLIATPADWDQLSPEEQQEMIEITNEDVADL